MAIATKSRASKAAKSKTSRYIGKPAGIIQQRVETVGPSRFGIIAVDCAKQRSKWMLCDFFGKVLVEPTEKPEEQSMFSGIDTLADSGIFKRLLRFHSCPGGLSMVRLVRCETLDPGEVNVAHVFTRVVRRCFLLGDDPVSGKNFDHRKV